MVTRDEMMERFESGRDELEQRRQELMARFADVSQKEVVVDAVGMSLVGAGIGTIVMGLIRGRRGVLTYVIGASFVIAGLGFLGGGAWGRRTERISAAEVSVREQLASLDPIARAQVLKDMAGEQVAPFVRHRSAPA